jgi:N-acetylated-alpha-linked acidic dipeptidase
MNPAWKDQELESTLLADISLDAPWALVERFSTLVRLSGSEEEAEAARHITDRLSEWGIEHTVFHPTCLISIPGKATLRTLDPHARQFTVKTTSFSPHTDGQEIEADLVYVPGHQAAGMNELFSEQRTATDIDLRGKVVMTEGLGIAARGFDLAASGAVGAIFINPGERIHEGITTTSWGSPDLDSLGRVAPVPILTINRPDGAHLIELLEQGPVRVAFSNTTDTGWRQIPVIVADIPGTDLADEFVLFHGHLDSWHVGVGDNATGDATLLEIARVMHQHRGSLRRSLRVAWWSGHSHGRYAGSTWYADTFAFDLMAHCVSHVNCDSPGCRWATVYENVAWMSEAEEFCKNTIRDVTGQESSGEGHVLRAGDISFNNLGVTTYFMLSSTMPDELREEKGYYSVGGCGGNIAWHTEDDTLEIADRDNLLRDMQVYAAVLLRSLNAPVVPFDYRATVDEMAAAVDEYQSAAGQRFDFTLTVTALNTLRRVLDQYYSRLSSLDEGATMNQLREANAAQRALARVLVSLAYTRDGRFRQDPARAIPTLPDLAPAKSLADAGSDMAMVIHTHLTRGQNRVVWELGQATQIAETVLAR